MKLLFQKIKNKAVLSICLCLGFVFLIAVFSCIPMFLSGALNTMLSTQCGNYIVEHNEYPGAFAREGVFSLGTEGTNASGDLIGKLDSYENTWKNYIDFPVLEKQITLSIPEQSAKTNYGKKGNYMQMTYAPNMLEHVNLLVSIDGVEGAYPCYISEQVMDDYGFSVGEQLSFVGWENAKKQNANSGMTEPRFYIAGVFAPKDRNDLFWYKSPYLFEDTIFVEMDAFDWMLENYSIQDVSYTMGVMFDYTYLQDKNEDDIAYYLEQFHTLDDKFYSPLSEITKSYEAEKKHVVSMLVTLTIPMFGMILAFMYMVAKQLVEQEQGEIAMLKSRGISRGGILLLYLKQMCVLAFVGFLVGEILGVGLAKLAASTTDFLTFKNHEISMYSITSEMLIYGIVAAMVGILFVLIPVYTTAKISIVEQKKNYNKNNRMLWKRYFLDVLLLGLSIYLLINYNRQGETIRQDALQGKLTDPVLFLNAVLFLFAMGLVTLRFIHYIVQLVYLLVKKKLKPAGYASFLQIIRNFKAQSFISLFLILTVSLGLFYANIARTLNSNQEKRITYNDGCDLILSEEWQMEKHSIMTEDKGRTVVYEYNEPDYSRFLDLKEQGLLDSMTKVMTNDGVMISKSGVKVENCQLQGIQTKEFGELAYLDDSLQRDEHWYHTLNALAENPQGAILSRNLATVLGVSEGDTITITKYNELNPESKEVRGQSMAKVVKIVDAWPGYKQYRYENGEMTEQYFLVVNYATAVAELKQSPYKIWCKLASGMTASEVITYLETQGIDVSYESLGKDISDMKQSALMQITNGMFSLSFIVAILLCMVGFLIYWITSIRGRELLLGVYRAMGMTVNEINRMLINEHIFSTLLSVLAGFGAGFLASSLFVHLFALVYLPEKHNIDILIAYQMSDIVKLVAVLGAMIIACLMILRQIVKALNITQALKIGED